MKWYNPYYDELVAVDIKDGNEGSSEIKKLLDLDKIMIDLEPKLEDENLKYMPLLHMAAASNSQEIVEVLLKNKADINAQNDQRNTALHLAVSDKNLDMVQILLDNGADSSIKNKEGNNPLHIATNCLSDIEIHTKGIGKSNLPVATATKQQISNQANEEIREVIPINVENLAKIQLGGASQGYSDSVKIIQALLNCDTNKESNKALINQPNYEGRRPIHLAVIKNNLDAVEVLLIDPRIDVNVRTETSGETALMMAVKANNYDMVKLLLNHNNIDHNMRFNLSNSGPTAFELALINNCSDNIIVTLWHNIEKRIGDGTLKNYSIKLEWDPQVEERLNRLKKDCGINLRPMVELTYSSSEESESEEYESDVSEESEILEDQELAILEHQETEPEPEISEVEVEAGSSAKRPRFG